MFSKNLTFSGSTQFSVSPRIIQRKNQDGTVVLMNLNEDNTFYKIDGVASQVWEYIDKMSMEKIISHLLKENDVSEKILVADTEKLVTELEQFGLIIQQ